MLVKVDGAEALKFRVHRSHSFGAKVLSLRLCTIKASFTPPTKAGSVTTLAVRALAPK